MATERLGSARPASPSDEAPVFTHREILIILGGILLGMLLAALDQTIVATALPNIAGELHGLEHMSWVVSAYLLTSTASTPIYGKLSDLYGRRAMLQIAILIFLASSILCALSGSMTQLILARALQGIGGGGLLAMAHATIGEVVSPRDRGRYQGYMGSVWATASVAGPVLGGLFVDHLSWRWVFWINLPIGLAAFVIARQALKRLIVPRIRHDIDYQGALLLVAGVSCALLVTSSGGVSLPWDSPWIAGLSVAAAVLLVVFLRRQTRAPQPILPLRLFANPVFRVCNIMGALVAMMMFGTTIYVPLYLQLVLGATPGGSGFLLVPLSAGIVIGAMSSGRLVSYTGRYKMFPTGGLALSTVCLTLLAMLGADASLWRLEILLTLAGIGIGCVLPTSLVAVQNSVTPADLGVASASVSFFRSLGGSFGVALLGAVLATRISAGLAAAIGPDAPTGMAVLRGGAAALAGLPVEMNHTVIAAVLGGFHTVFLVCAAIGALAFLVSLRLEERPLSTRPMTARAADAEV